MPTYTTNYNLPKPNVNSPDDEDLWGDQLNDGMDLIDTQMKANADAVAAIVTVPTGCILDYGGTTAPSGYVLCYGQAISRTTYAALFAILGTTYGSGDGSTTFNVPDLRGRVSAGKDDMGGTSADRLTDQSGGVDGDTLGDTGGSETHTLTEAELAVHDHLLWRTTNNTIGGSNSLVNANMTGNQDTMTDEAGGDQPHNNVQPTIILNKIIKT